MNRTMSIDLAFPDGVQRNVSTTLSYSNENNIYTAQCTPFVFDPPLDRTLTDQEDDDIEDAFIKQFWSDGFKGEE